MTNLIEENRFMSIRNHTLSFLAGVSGVGAAAAVVTAIGLAVAAIAGSAAGAFGAAGAGVGIAVSRGRATMTSTGPAAAIAAVAGKFELKKHSCIAGAFTGLAAVAGLACALQAAPAAPAAAADAVEHVVVLENAGKPLAVAFERADVALIRPNVLNKIGAPAHASVGPGL